MMRFSFKRLFSFCLTVIATATFVAAQKDSKPAPVEKGSAQEVKTRSRRAAVGRRGEKVVGSAQAPEASEQQPKGTTPAIEAPNSAKPLEAEPPKEETVETEADNSAPPADPILSLRDQIAAAPTVTEKVRLQFELIDLLVAKGAKQEAVNELRLMSLEDRFDPQGFYNIGNAQARLNDSEAAATTYRKAIGQRKGRYSKALNNLGVVMLRLGNWDEAYDAFNSALRLENFRYAEASYNLGRLYMARGEVDLATREWKRAVTVNPEHTAAAQALARAGSAGRISIVGKLKQVATESLTPSSSKPREMVAPKPAIARASAAAKTLTVDRQSYNYLQRARDARERGREEEAVTNYRRVISLMGGYFGPANLEMSYALITLRRTDDAMASLLAVTENDGARYPISYYHLARLYEMKGELKLAEEGYARAASSYGKDNAQFLLDISRVREKRGDLQGALSSLEEYVAIMERQNLRPQWSEDRVAALKQKLAAAQPKP